MKERRLKWRYTIFIVKMSIFPIIGLMIYWLNATPSKVLIDTDKLILKLVQEGMDPRIAQTILTS